MAEPPGRTVSIKYLSIHWVLMNWTQGTWQFIAADLVMDPKINHTFVHDLESAFYVVLWLSIKFLPNSWSASTRRFVMSQLFNPDAFPTVGCSSKRNWMRNAVSEIGNFNITGNEALQSLLVKLARLFQYRHMAIKSSDPPSPTRYNLSEPTSSLAPSQGAIQAILEDIQNKTAATQAATQVFQEVAWVGHNEVIRLFKNSLKPGASWPDKEPTTKQEIGRARGEMAARSSNNKRSSQSVRRKDVGKQGTSQKRLRTK